MLAQQAGFLFQLPEQSLFRAFTGHHAALGKLPGIAVAHPATPEHPAVRAGDHNADVQPVSFVVNNACHCLQSRGNDESPPSPNYCH